MAVEYENKNNSEAKIVEIPTVETSHGNRGLQKFQTQYKQHLLVFGSLLVALLILIVVWMIVVLITCQAPNANSFIQSSQGSPAMEPSTEKYGSVSAETSFPLIETDQENSTYVADPQVNYTLKVVSRSEWLAQPPVEALTALQLPARYVIISHTATGNCTDLSSCIYHIRYIQMFHMESKNWWDISYNFLVGGDGYAYEGRGWKSEGAHTYGYNAKSIGIGLIGSFNEVLPPEKQILAAKRLIQRGVELGYIARNYKVLAARQLGNTASPGLKLYENMKTWPHWSEEP